MTLSEVRSAVLNSPNKDWLDKNARAVIDLPHINVQEDLVGFTTVYEFINRQCSNWSGKKESLPSSLERSRSHFKEILSQLQQFVNSYVRPEKNLNQVNSQWGNIQRSIETRNPNNEAIFTAEAPETDFLIALHKDLPLAVSGAMDFITQRLKQNQFANPDYFTGILQAYEWKLADKSAIQQARKSQKANLGRIRSQFNNYLKDAENDLEQHYQTTRNKTDEAAKALDKLVAEKKTYFDGWFQETRNEFGDFNTISKKSLQDLEDLYEKKLQLHAPAKFWKVRAAGLDADGKRWMGWLIGSSCLAVVLLFILLILLSNGTLKEIFTNTGAAIKWSVIFITFISFLAYAIRTFSKLTFSAFHLKRDAEERRQLVYVYLALAKDKNIDDTERHLVMQSIFSRADSGLLKEDSSPTMPGNIIDKVLGRGSS